MTNKIAGFEKVREELRKVEKATLTKKVDADFKMAFNYLLEPRYGFLSLDRVFHPDCYLKNQPDRLLTDIEKLELFRAFGSFVENSVTMTYDQVDKKYGGHKPDKCDKKIDDGEEYSVFHYQLALEGLGKTARLHGYIKNGHFVVIRVDWSHSFHTKEKPKS